MKNWLVILVIGLGIISCRQKRIKVEPTKTVLEGKKVDVSSIYKKRTSDIVEALYVELVSGSAELTELEEQIKELKRQAPDSLRDFRSFNDKNNIYYGLANKKIAGISDSILRKKMQRMIDKSRQLYADSTASLKELETLINKRIATINDLHTILKLVKTLPLIEDFQRNTQPPDRPADNALYALDSLVNRIDTLIKADTLAAKFKL